MRTGVGVGIGKRGRRMPPELVEQLGNMPRTKIEWLAEPLALAAIVAQIVLLALQYAALPELIPTHFGGNGLPNGYGGKSTLLVLLAVNIGMYLLMTLAGRYPQLYNFPVAITAENLQRQYLLARYMLSGLKVLLSWMFFYFNYQSMAVALGRAAGLGPGVWIILGLILLSLPPVFILAYKWR